PRNFKDEKAFRLAPGYQPRARRRKRAAVTTAPVLGQIGARTRPYPTSRHLASGPRTLACARNRAFSILESLREVAGAPRPPVSRSTRSYRFRKRGISDGDFHSSGRR